jgi:glycosyltransferase involved in cell wall biosynthesis
MPDAPTTILPRNGGISGYTYVRNAISLDYCVLLCIQSLLPACDEVIVCDSDSTDGTREMLDAWAEAEPKLRIINRPWPNPVGDIKWMVKWMNYVRDYCYFPNQLYLDADEVLDPASVPVIRRLEPGACRTFHRLNFFTNARTLIPHGQTCSHLVTRYGPTILPSCSDEIYAPGHFDGPEPEIRQRATYDPALRIFHYGFLRHQAAMHDKCRVVLRAFFDTWDTRLDEARDRNMDWRDICAYQAPTLPFDEPHPDFCLPWLNERNAL